MMNFNRLCRFFYYLCNWPQLSKQLAKHQMRHQKMTERKKVGKKFGELKKKPYLCTRFGKSGRLAQLV